jgi:GT2 family glycosyltransferase
VNDQAPTTRSAPTELSVVVLTWDNLPYTRAFVDSVRRHTDVPYELIIVDNGSKPDAAQYARIAADRVELNDENRGFAAGMNQGLALATGEYVAFCNNDTVLPAAWASRLLGTARAHPRAGLVVPAITTASNPVTVRSTPGDHIEVLDPFSAPPAGVIYLMARRIVTDLGAWEEEYAVASAEDVDLCFKVWVNDLDIVYDQRVLVEHVGHATGSRLEDSQRLWADNRARFLAKWTGDVSPPHLASCDPERFARNRATARAVAGWMQQYFTIRDRKVLQGQKPTRAQPASRARRAASRSVRFARRVARRVTSSRRPGVTA